MRDVSFTMFLKIMRVLRPASDGLVRSNEYRLTTSDLLLSALLQWRVWH